MKEKDSNSKKTATENTTLLLLCITLLLTGLTTSAQTHVTGRVMTADSIPVQNAVVKLRSLDSSAKEFGTLTDQLGNFSFTLVTGVKAPTHASDFVLHQNFPNPFSDGTTIPFELRAGARVRMEIVDVLGRRVRKLLEDYREAGKGFVAWDGADDGGAAAPLGMYFAVSTCGRQRAVSKILRGPATAPSGGAVQKATDGGASAFRKSAGARMCEMEVRDTIIAGPHFYSLKKLPFAVNTDTFLTIGVHDSSRWRFLGLEGAYVRHLVLIDSLLFACTYGQGLKRKNINDSTSQWESLSFNNPDIIDAFDVAIYPQDLKRIIVSCGKRSAAKYFMFVSNDSGYTWMKADTGIEKYATQRMKLVNNNIIGIGTGVHYSTDFGISWNILANGPHIDRCWVLEQHIKDQMILVCAGPIPIITDSYDAWMSTDGGVSWSTFTNFPFHGSGHSISSAAISTTMPPTIYITTGLGMIKSIDFGNTWTGPIIEPPDPQNSDLILYSIVVNNNNDRDVWAGYSLFYCSQNSGFSWNVINTPFSGNKDILSMKSSSSSNSLYIGTSNGVYLYHP